MMRARDMLPSVTHPCKTVQPDVALIPVSTRALLHQFVELPYTLYRHQPHWVPPLRRDEHRRLSPVHNPFWDHARMDLWLASSNGRVTGRIAAIEDRLCNERHGDPVTWFGFFEAEDGTRPRR